MSQRSQTNDRYRKGAEIGSTRKSAARAKPVRQAATVEVGSASKSAKKKPKGRLAKAMSSAKGQAGSASKSSAPLMPTSPEIKKWRTVWWVLLSCALVLLAAAWLVPTLRTNSTANMVVTIGVFVLCGAGIYIDAIVIRRLRNQLIEAQKKGKRAAKAVAKATEDAKRSGKPDAEVKESAQADASVINKSTSPLGGLFKKKKG